MKVVVTGGGGFLGGRIAEFLRQRGDEVTVVGRRPYPRMAALGMRTLQADVRNAAAMERCAAGMDAVIHVAAVTDLWGDRKYIWSVNVDGTRNVVAACRHHGVRRLVYTSTPSVVFGEQEICGGSESLPYPDRFLAAYPESKAAAEQMVLAANDAPLSTVALRPHLIWGPGDPHLIPRVLERARRGRLVQVGDGSNEVDITYIDNAAAAHLLALDALDSGRCAGQAYFISQGQPVRLWAWLGQLLERLGVPPISKSVSYRAARRIGILCEWLYRVPGVPGEPGMTRFLAAQLAKSHYFDISAARRDLRYDPQVSTATGLERLVAALREAE